jgi:FAD/FMN-containing dehydrogenase
MLPGAVWQTVLAFVGLSTPVSKPWNLKLLFGPHLSPDAAIYLPSDKNAADHVTPRWTTHAAPSYAGTIVPATVDDVANVVKVAAAHEIPFLVTGGGHGVSVQMEGLQGGVQVDLGGFNSVDFDPEARLLTIGGGVRFSQLIPPLVASGNQFRTFTLARRPGYHNSPCRR